MYDETNDDFQTSAPARAAIPAVVHVDGSARVQLVEPTVGHRVERPR